MAEQRERTMFVLVMERRSPLAALEAIVHAELAASTMYCGLAHYGREPVK